MLSVGTANTRVVCSDVELLTLQPPTPGTTCAQYMGLWIDGPGDGTPGVGGYLVNPEATADCGYCPVADTNVFLAQVNSSYATRWRDFGVMWSYVVFNVAVAVGVYWLARVPKKSNEKREKKKAEKEA